MTLSKYSVFFLILITTGTGYLQSPELSRSIIGSAFYDNQSYQILQHICDGMGGRLAGTPENRKTVEFLLSQARSRGWTAGLQNFDMPGWFRGEDEIKMVEPRQKELQAVALGYVDKTDPFTVNVIFLNHGTREDFQGKNITGKGVLVSSGKPGNQEPPLRQEVIEWAASNKARAVFFINDQAGNVNRAGTGDFQGHPTPIPAFSLTREEGLWLVRLLEQGESVKVNIHVRSSCSPVVSQNVVVTMNGQVPGKIVVGAHLDAWDIAQGGIDNGLGTAILFDVARLLHRYSPGNYHTVEFVWFNGEELGLLGSKFYAASQTTENVIAMINMDMTGSPAGFNAMGFDSLIPVLQELVQDLNGLNLTRGVVSRPWTNSDHMPFLFKGIPVVTLQATLDQEMRESYHSQSDTFDKVNKKYLSEAAAVVSLLTIRLANDRSISQFRKDREETIDLFQRFQLENKLKSQKEWPFGGD